MRKQKAFLVVSLVLLLLGMGACGCNQPCTPCPPTPTPIDTSALETQVAALETALAECEGTTTTVEGDGCVKKPLCHPEAISAQEAKAYVGEIKIVQGEVADADFASGSSGKPTFLNLCCPYPEPCRFTALIWGEDRQEFIDCLDGPPEQVLLNREVCVEGLIKIYEGIPEIILTQCDQLTIIQ